MRGVRLPYALCNNDEAAMLGILGTTTEEGESVFTGGNARADEKASAVRFGVIDRVEDPKN
jgi:hypothetical protein